MKILKNCFQNLKGLYKLDTKHVSHAPKEDLLKSQKFEFLKKNKL